MSILLPGFCAALILVGIHAYLGIHVIMRGVIFVDLAMAQSAALGTIVGFLFFGHGPTHPICYLFSLGFTLVHAVLFAAGRSKRSRIPDEAIIGLTYAILSAVTVLLIDRAPHGAERIRDMLAGHVLWVDWSTVLTTALLYGSIGLIHFFWHKRFLLVSQDPEGARKQGIFVAFWDFLFYATFGIIITSSVAIGGVLLVFTLLVAPAILGFLYAETIKGRLMVGYAFGFFVTLGGFVLSYYLDFPTGATVVALFGALLFPLGLWRFVQRYPEGRTRRAIVVVGGLLGVSGLLFFAWDLGSHHRHEHEHHHQPGHGLLGTHKLPTKPSTSQDRAVPPRRAGVSGASNTPRTNSADTSSKQGHKPTDQHSDHSDHLGDSDASTAPGKSKTKREGPASPKELQALLHIVEGRTDAPLLERQQAFDTLCQKTKGALPGCPFSGDLLQMGEWLKQRAAWMRNNLQPRSAPPAKQQTPTPRPFKPVSSKPASPTSKPIRAKERGLHE